MLLMNHRLLLAFGHWGAICAELLENKIDAFDMSGLALVELHE